MIARDITTGAGSDRTKAGSTDSSETPSSTTTTSRLRSSVVTTSQRTEISDVGEATSQLSVEDSVIGFIRQVGRLFVVLTGDRLDLSEECGQYQSWELAVQELLTRSGLAGAPDALEAKRVRQTAKNGRAANVRPGTAQSAKAGELLAFRRHSRPRGPETIRSPVDAEARIVIILHGGREFHTTRERAERFYAWARTVVDSGVAALVPLGHDDGVDLLLITGNTPLE